MMNLKSLFMLVVLGGLALPMTGCGGHKAGVAEGPNEEPPPLTKEQEAAERANARKAGAR